MKDFYDLKAISMETDPEMHNRLRYAERNILKKPFDKDVGGE